MGSTGPVNLTVCDIEHGPVEIVDLPSYKIMDLSIVMWQRLPEGSRGYRGSLLRSGFLIKISRNPFFAQDGYGP